jgi:hypothetical protein
MEAKSSAEDHMSFFNSIIHFFEKLFGGDAPVVQTILTDINALYKDAQPIVAALSAALGTAAILDPSSAITKIEGVLRTFVTDSAAVEAWLVKNSGLSLPNLLQNAAVFALSFISGNSIVKDLQLAVQLAYNVFAAMNPTITGQSTVISLGKR